MPPPSTAAANTEPTRPDNGRAAADSPRTSRRHFSCRRFARRWGGVIAALGLIYAALVMSRVLARMEAIVALQEMEHGVGYKIEGPARTAALWFREAVRDLQTGAPFTMPDCAGVVDWPPLQALQGEITGISVQGDLFLGGAAPVDFGKLSKAVHLCPGLRFFRANGRDFAPTEGGDGPARPSARRAEETGMGGSRLPRATVVE